MNQAKNALLVGATAGIGKETARLLANDGYHVILVGRNQAAGEQLAREFGGTFIQVDVSLLSEVRRVAERIKAQVASLDLIIHTADVLRIKRLETAEGLEVSIATNYYGRFLLNYLLLDEAPGYQPTRIVHVAAAGIPPGKNFREKFPIAADASSFTGHNVGQVANDFYGLTLAGHRRNRGTRVNILNPGIVDTDIRRRAEGGPILRGLMGVMEWLMGPFTQTPSEYARLVAAIATGKHPVADQSVLINRKGKAVKPSAPLVDTELQRYVWEQTERVVGIRTAGVVQS